MIAVAVSCVNLQKRHINLHFDILTYRNTSIYTGLSINVFKGGCYDARTFQRFIQRP